MDTQQLRYRLSILTLSTAVALITACSSSDPSLRPANVSGLEAGTLGQVPKDVPPSPGGSWMSPGGEIVVDGQRDANGYVLPLDIRRPRAPREERQRPSRVRIEMLRALQGPGPFPEVRLGQDDGHTENETSIDALGSTVVAGWNQWTDDSLQQGVGRSGDAGLTWTTSVLGGHSVMSDPVVASAGGKRWFFGYIASDGGSDFDVFVRRSDDDGVTWQAPVTATDNSTFDDKPYFVARGDEVLVAYADFSFSPAKIRAVRSLDGGLSFGSDTILANQSVGGNGASPVIAPDGTYYVFWRDSFQQFLWMSMSDDQGTTWSTDVSIAPMVPLPSSLPPGFRIVNLPVAAVHPDGTLVVLWNDQALGDADILSIRSTDGGTTWSAPIRVNEDTSGQPQFFPWLDFDATSGIAHAVWYDMRNDGANIDVYTTTSDNAGLTWQASRRVTASSFTPVLPFEPGAADFIGDYNGIAAASGRAYPLYQDSREGNQDVWVSVVESDQLFGDGFEGGDVSAWSAVSP